LFSTAVFFLLLHNIAPHLHHSELIKEKDCEEHQVPEGFLDWLAMSFHFDLGEGHLEYFPKVNKADVDHEFQVMNWDDLQPPIALYHLAVEDIFPNILLKNDSNRKLTSCASKCSILLRGPPSNA